VQADERAEPRLGRDAHGLPLAGVDGRADRLARGRARRVLGYRPGSGQFVLEGRELKGSGAAGVPVAEDRVSVEVGLEPWFPDGQRHRRSQAMVQGAPHEEGQAPPPSSVGDELQVQSPPPTNAPLTRPRETPWRALISW